MGNQEQKPKAKSTPEPLPSYPPLTSEEKAAVLAELKKTMGL